MIKKKIKLINQKNNSGYGSSIKLGLKNAAFDNYLITDADNTYPNEDILNFSNNFFKSKSDMIIGDRTKVFYKNFFTYLTPKNIGREIIRIFSSVLTNYNIKDINSGYRIFTKKLYSECSDFLPNGFSLTSSITCLAINYNYTIEYKEIPYRKKKRQKQN